MSERALAHIEIVHDIEPIEGADFIEYAHVLGWGLVVGKGEFHEGDKCVYFEIDSKVDTTKPVFAFMEKNDGKVKTRKFKGRISQGLALSLDKFDIDLSKYKVGDDVTKLLGVTKIQTDEEKRLQKEKEASITLRFPKLYKKIMKNKVCRILMKNRVIKKIVNLIFKKKVCPKSFPDFITKTDEIRIENSPNELLNKKPLVETEKLNGTSTTFFIKKKFHHKYEFGICSRNLRITYIKKDSNSIYVEMAYKYRIKDVLLTMAKELNYPNTIVLQGETIGNVQGNPYKLTSNEFYAFNLIVDSERWGSVEAFNYISNLDYKYKFDVRWVPILNENFICPDTMEEMKHLADGKSAINHNVDREGVVYRSTDGKRSFKNVSNKYLLRHE